MVRLLSYLKFRKKDLLGTTSLKGQWFANSILQQVLGRRWGEVLVYPSWNYKILLNQNCFNLHKIKVHRIPNSLIFSLQLLVVVAGLG
jgi:hypothetical protein